MKIFDKIKDFIGSLCTKKQSTKFTLHIKRKSGERDYDASILFFVMAAPRNMFEIIPYEAKQSVYEFPFGFLKAKDKEAFKHVKCGYSIDTADKSLELDKGVEYILITGLEQDVTDDLKPIIDTYKEGYEVFLEELKATGVISEEDSISMLDGTYKYAYSMLPNIIEMSPNYISRITKEEQKIVDKIILFKYAEEESRLLKNTSVLTLNIAKDEKLDEGTLTLDFVPQISFS